MLQILLLLFTVSSYQMLECLFSPLVAFLRFAPTVRCENLLANLYVVSEHDRDMLFV